jgi:2'-5' RNA ligase
LARVKHPLAEPAADALARAAETIDFHAECIVQSIELMQSELSAAGPKYTTLVSAPLRSG